MDPHLMLCPDEDRMCCLVNNVEELSKWHTSDNRTDPDLAFYWTPKYILKKGDKPFLAMGSMSPIIKATTESQDLIGLHNFDKGSSLHSSMKTQNFHLVMTSSYFKDSGWTKQFIFKILHIT